MKLTIIATAILLAASVTGRSGGAAQSLPVQDSPRHQVLEPSSGMTPVLSSPTPTPHTATSSIQIAPSYAESDVSAIEALICTGRAWPCSEALAVAFCESRYDPAAQNPSGAKGLWQFMPVHDWRLGPGETFYDPVVATRIAFEVWSEQGWKPWRSCR